MPPSAHPTPGFRRPDLPFLAAAFLIPLAAYLLTACPTVYEGDSGELIAAAATLGVPHPTGFPLYLLVGRLFMGALPFGEPALRLGLVSAFFAAAAAAALQILLRTLGMSRTVATAAALFLGFSATLWSHATAARVYSMAACFMLIVLWRAGRWAAGGDARDALALGVAAGLGLGTHATVALAVSAALVLLLAGGDPRRPRRRDLGLAAVTALLVAASLYLYLPLAAGREPVICWDRPTHLKTIVSYLTQRDYSFKMGARSLGETAGVGRTVAGLALAEFTWLGAALAVLGLVRAARRARAVLAATLLLYLGNVALMIYYGNQQDLFLLYRYLFPSYLAVAVWIGYGLAWLEEMLARRLRPGAAAVILLALPLAGLFAHYRQNDRSRNFIVYDYGANLLDSVEPGGILITQGDAIFGTLVYQQLVLGKRPDVVHVEQHLIEWDWYAERLARRHPEIAPRDLARVPAGDRLFRLIEANFGRRPVFSLSLFLERYQNTPWGLVTRLSPRGEAPSPAVVDSVNGALWARYTRRGLFDARLHRDEMVAEIVKFYSKSRNHLGLFFVQQGRPDRAAAEYEESLRYNPASFPSLLMLSELRRQAGDTREADSLAARARQVNPHNEDYAVLAPAESEAAARARVHLEQGADYGRRGDHARAAEEFRQAVAADSTCLPAYVSLGTTYLVLRDLDRAQEAYGKAIALDPGAASSVAYLNLGLMLANERQDYAAAVKNLSRYLELNPQAPQAEELRRDLARLEALARERAPGGGARGAGAQGGGGRAP